MAVKKFFSFDKSDQQKPASEMTRLDVIIDFFVFIGISAGYVIQVCLMIRQNQISQGFDYDDNK
jgi:hypothetical protein